MVKPKKKRNQRKVKNPDQNTEPGKNPSENTEPGKNPSQNTEPGKNPSKTRASTNPSENTEPGKNPSENTQQPKIQVKTDHKNPGGDKNPGAQIQTQVKTKQQGKKYKRQNVGTKNTKF
ncbi:hypothetical protein HYE19_03850 [Mycoplasmopsis bovis]|nr:hypothetical protein HYE19_03850 [Mycoplasmopsis bovis]